jgi:hypothetical protein
VNISGSVFAYNVSGAGGALFNDQEGKGSITGSCILENQVIGVTPEGFGNGIENDNDTPFDATQNWWDTATGPGNSVTNGVNAAPYLSAAPEICAGSIPTAVPTPAAP